jgi:hypothetical protein
MSAHHLNRPSNSAAATNGWLALTEMQLKHNSRRATTRRNPTITRSSWSEPQMSFDQAECGKLTAPATCGKLERQLQLIVSMPLEQLTYRVTDEPGEGNTVFLCQRRQLLVVPLVDADRDPCRQLFPTPGSHRGLYPPKHCITVVNGAAMYCEAVISVNQHENDPRSYPQDFECCMPLAHKT